MYKMIARVYKGMLITINGRKQKAMQLAAAFAICPPRGVGFYFHAI
jgi:hypothetical protein